MHEKILPKIKKSAQTRSDLTKENIFQAAESIFRENDPEILNARNLAKKSGYSIGTLYYYLSKAEDAFIIMIIRRRERQFMKLVSAINDFPCDQPVNMLAQIIINSSFEELNKMNKRSFYMIFKMILRFSRDPLKFDDAVAVLVPPLLGAQKRDSTGTFRQTSDAELLMLLKICFAIIRRPFLEQLEIAGKDEHRKLALDTMDRLLCKR